MILGSCGVYGEFKKIGIWVMKRYFMIIKSFRQNEAQGRLCSGCLRRGENRRL